MNIYYLRDFSFKCTFTCIIALGSCNNSVRKPGQLLLVCLYQYYEMLLKRKIKDHEFIQKHQFLKEMPKWKKDVPKIQCSQDQIIFYRRNSLDEKLQFPWMYLANNLMTQHPNSMIHYVKNCKWHTVCLFTQWKSLQVIKFLFSL